MRLILVRHGVTKENLERRFLGVTDVSLAPEGIRQAVLASQNLPPVEHIYTSPLLRCRQTADLLWKNMPQTIIPELRETDFGPFEGKTHLELADDPLYNQWLSFPDDPTIIPMAENAVSCGLRATKALETIAALARAAHQQTVGVVSHGGTLMAMLARHGRPAHEYYSWRMDNCGGYIVQLDETALLLQMQGKISAPLP